MSEHLNAKSNAAEYRRIRARQWAEAREAAARLNSPISAEEMDAFLMRYGDNHIRFPLFLSLLPTHAVTPEAYAHGLRHAYTMGDVPAGVRHKDVLQLFANVEEKRHIMTAEELRTYRKLPDVVHIFRGCSKLEVTRRQFGCSWTTRQQIAEFFAWRRNAEDSSRVVVVADVPKADALAFFAERDEYEIIADVSRAKTYTTIEQPSPLFWEYMEQRNKF